MTKKLEQIVTVIIKTHLSELVSIPWPSNGWPKMVVYNGLTFFIHVAWLITEASITSSSYVGIDATLLSSIMDAKLHKRQKQIKTNQWREYHLTLTKVWYSESTLKGSYKRRHWSGTRTTNFVRLERCLPGLSLANAIGVWSELSWQLKWIVVA